MPQASANGIKLEYDVWGEGGDPVLIIAGHAGQLTAVPDAFMAELVARGFRPIRFDNRDVGLSTVFDEAGLPDFGAIRAALAEGRPAPVAYTLVDMAADAAGLLDVLGIEGAHIFGGSMGGMIAQILASDYPERVKSLVSFMSSSGNPALPAPAADVLTVMQAPIDPPGDIAAIVEHKINIFRRIGSPAYPTPVEVMRERFTAEALRSQTPGGVARQSAAIMATGDRRDRLRKIRCPTVVIHGMEDPLVPLAAGEDTARNIPGAALRVVSGMGHDFPDVLASILADAVSAAAARVRPA